MAEGTYTRNVAILAACQALFFMANTVVISVTALVGLQYAPSPGLATVPLGLQFVGTMLMTLPASFLMQRVGRRPGLLIGAVLAILAGLIGWRAIMDGSFWQFAAASFVYGLYGACAQYYRFTAADAADVDPPKKLGADAARGRAISWVMAGGTVAAVLGPQLAVATRDLFAPITFAGCFAAVAALGAASLLLLLGLRIPHGHGGGFASAGRPLAEIARDPRAVLAFAGALVAYVTMNLLMTATPLAMQACGYGFSDAAFVIQWHVLGMFLPSFAAGWLTARLGSVRMIGLGVLVMFACVAVDLKGIQIAHFAWGLMLLGVGWNFMFVGGTTLLTCCYAAQEKAKVQGLNDFLIFTFVGISATSSGALHQLVGWTGLNLAVLPGLLLVGALVLVRLQRPLVPSAA
ncbi:MAG: MFS transporter [Geminicoccaceae bacterium]